MTLFLLFYVYKIYKIEKALRKSHKVIMWQFKTFSVKQL